MILNNTPMREKIFLLLLFNIKASALALPLFSIIYKKPKQILLKINAMSNARP